MPGPPGAPVPWPLGLCAQALDLDGLGLRLATDSTAAEVVHISGERALALEDLQQTQGQGPSVDAVHLGTPLLVPDVKDPATNADGRWPTLPVALQELGICAVFAFPLRIGATTLGALTGHRVRPGQLGIDQFLDSLALADHLAERALDQAARPQDEAVTPADAPGLPFAAVHQATGMVAAQLAIPCAEALALLRGYAYAHHRPLLSCADDVLHRRLHLPRPDRQPQED
ncbi:ANTAR domain-containing protein [Streptomyces sp. NPDC004111]|uniref:ANTAR domain-containing protein n=1 Tax=Streptomyces sp. NPDC004111 TaxID=3364690 RepID=UPI003697F2ED